MKAVKAAAAEAVNRLERAAQVVALRHCSLAARTVADVSAAHYLYEAVEEAVSRAEELALSVALEHCLLAAKIVALAAAKSVHSAWECTAAVVAQ